jgi:hypothetical protein
MASRFPPPALLPINPAISLPPPALPIMDETAPPLVPLAQTTLSASRNVPPALTDLNTMQLNREDWNIEQFKKEMAKIEAQLQDQANNFTRNLQIERYIHMFALIAMNDARKMQASLKDAGLTTANQLAIDEIVVDFVKEMNEIKAQLLPPAVTQQLITALDEKAKLAIKNIETPAGLMPAIQNIYLEIFKMLMQVGIKGVFLLGKNLRKHKAILAKGADKAYTSAYWIISSYLFSTLSSFLIYVLDPSTFQSDMSVYGNGTANITELLGGRRRKHRTQKRNTKKTRKTHKRKTNKRK